MDLQVKVMCRMKPMYQRQGCSNTKYSPAFAFFHTWKKRKEKTNKQIKF